jgi:rhamnogalacturonan endolyase
MEMLDRGVVAINQGGGKVFVSWRLLATDPDDVAFDVFANDRKLNDQPIKDVTFLEQSDAKLDAETKYSVRPTGKGESSGQSKGDSFTLAAGAPPLPYLNVPLKTPEGYAPGDTSAADLDGDGQYELIVHMTGRGKDNSQSGQTDPPIFHAYRLDGTMLWSINLGPNVREGAHYSQPMVMDFNGDGYAELIVKTADGATDAKGKVVGDANARHANEGGHVQQGPEFLSVFDGRSGEVLDTIPYNPGRAGPGADGSKATSDQIKAIWGDGYGNRGDRYLAGVAYLDGVRPTAIMCRGYYTRSFLWAVDFDGQKLKERWLFDSEDPKVTERNEITAPSTRPARPDRGGTKPNAYSGQGYHSLSIADVDEDGKDEIVYGSMTVDDDGKGLYVTGWGHGDAQHVGDLDPSNPGLEIFGIQERFDDAGAHMHDARTGKPLWKKPSAKAATEGGDKGEGPGRGVAFDIDPRTPGAESWTAGAGIEGVWDAKGNQIGTTKPPSCNFRIYWDGDLLDELLDKNRIDKWNWETQKADRLLTAEGAESNNGTKANPALSADLLGDWREEVVFRASDNQSLRIYTTTIPTKYRRYTLMQDPQYRLAIAWQNVAYNQPPHLSVNMMDLEKGPPPKPKMTIVEPKSSTAAK